MSESPTSSSSDDDQIAQTMQQHLLAYLRSVLHNSSTDRVRIMTHDDSDDESDSSYEDDIYSHPTVSLETEQIKREFFENMDRKLESLKESEFGMVLGGWEARQNVFLSLRERMQYNDVQYHRFQQIHTMTSHCVPNYQEACVANLGESLFCGKFSDDGEIFVSACQDQVIRLYKVRDVDERMREDQQRRFRASMAAQSAVDENASPVSDDPMDISEPDVNDDEENLSQPYREIYARDIGWSIISVDFSPDQRHLVYSSWSPFLHLIDITKSDDATHEPLNLEPEGRFCGFSTQFSPSSKEILVGGTSGAIILYDLERKRRKVALDGHDADVNTVAYAQKDNDNVFYSGSDDTTCKVWDKRMLSNNDSRPAGVLNGHSSGLTHIDSKGDGVYFVSNSKDQTLKLWDIRRMTDPDEAPLRINPDLSRFMDYRYQMVPSRYTYASNPNDQSLTTYTGHRVLRTLIRCYFSPQETTGQRYVYSGSFDGSVFIWNLLTGQLVQKLTAHSEVVRDAAWHPRLPMIWSSGWDNMIISWGYFPEQGMED